ncbi:hypothetical protein DUI87_17242 [Hirundo rustica rustica]|uniref:Uncharacterized protein n=1 Tax=Hirundo rustica rustica TaxID=333673 RepID=A0A3M0JXQ6_HIRRU|nr:hypothetical protein DUI87_17242 [Hirundo rustica rustica]
MRARGVGGLKMKLVYSSAQGCFGTVGNNLVFLVAMRSLLAVLSGIPVLKSPLCVTFASTAPGRHYFSAHELLQVLGRQGAPVQNISSASGHNKILRSVMGTGNISPSPFEFQPGSTTPPVPLTVDSVQVQEDFLIYGIETGSFLTLKPAVISSFGDVLESTWL